MVVLFLVASTAFAVDVDGRIGTGEYAREASFDNGNFKVFWTIDQDRIFMALDVKANGWISIGFEPSRVMADADMIFGMVPPSGPVEAIDAFSTGTFGPHPPDANLGGKNDVLQFAGTRNGDRIIFEFVRLLDTGDRYDKKIPATGKLKIIWAYGPNFTFSAKHLKAGAETLDL